MKAESNTTFVPCDAITAPVDDNAPIGREATRTSLWCA